MMNYKKGKNVEEELTRENIPIENLPADFLWMHVKGGTKVANVIDFAKNAFNNKEHRSVVWSGSGGGVTKTVSCAEIMKRDFELHQVTRLGYQKVEEYWDPQLDGLEPIIATREIPAIHILLTLDEISDNLMGHQFSKTGTKFWAEKPSNTSRGNRNGNKDGSNSDNQSRRNDRNRRVQKAGGPNKTAGGSSNNRSADMEINK